MKAALVSLGMTVKEFYDSDPYELGLMLEAANERRRREHESSLRLAAFIVNAAGTRSSPLDVELLLSSGRSSSEPAATEREKHEKVRAKLMNLRRPN